MWLIKGVSVAFDYESQKDCVVQIFHASDASISFDELYSIKKIIAAGKGRTEVYIPTNKLARIRIDVGDGSGLVILSNLQIHGRKNVNLDLERFTAHNIEHYEVKDGIATVISLSGDPYLVYREPLNEKGSYKIEWLVFITFCIVIYFLTSRGVKYMFDFKLLGSASRRDIGFVSVFYVLLFLPMMRINDDAVSKEENRVLAEKPDLGKLYDEQYNYGSLFDKWYSDRFFCRKYLIRLHNYLGWGESRTGNERVALGKDGWMFYKGDYNALDFLNEHPATDAELKKSADYVAALASWCRKNNKGFYFFVAPNKHKVYHEYYGMGTNHTRTSNRESMINRFLSKAQERGISTIYPLEEMLQAKQSGYLLYWKHDTHWNTRGAYIGYLALMQRIKEMGTPAKIIEPEYEACVRYGRDLEAMYPNVLHDDSALYMEFKEKSDIITIRKDSAPRGITVQKNPRKQGKVVLYRDSFTSALAPYLSETFGEVTYIWRYHPEAGDYEKYLQHADIIILEAVERYVPRLGQKNLILQ